MKITFQLILFISGLSFSANAADILKDFDSLGGNNSLYQKAEALAPEKEVSIVQKRVVNRINRHEFGGQYSILSGGDAYLRSQNAGLSYQFHLNPHWSFGLKYNHYFNELSAEGKRVIDEGLNSNDAFSFIPELNWQKSSTMAVVNWYPTYGKINVFDKGIVHFDVYAIGGAGQTQLRKGTSDIYMGGVGLGFWISQHISSRLEYTKNFYTVDLYTGPQEVQTDSVNFSLGYLL